MSPSYDGADVVVVNTCGFIDSAVDESLDAIGEALGRERQGHRHRLSRREARADPRAPSGRAGGHRPAAYEAVVDAVHEHLPPQHDPFLDLVPPQGIRLTPRHYAYLKISEGCNNECSFCIIPSMRGDAGEPANRRSACARPRRWCAPACKELLVISQDTSAYGVDIRYRRSRVARRELRNALHWIWPRRSAHSASGCGCTTSIPIRTWTR